MTNFHFRIKNLKDTLSNWMWKKPCQTPSAASLVCSGLASQLTQKGPGNVTTSNIFKNGFGYITFHLDSLFGWNDGWFACSIVMVKVDAYCRGNIFSHFCSFPFACIYYQFSICNFPINIWLSMYILTCLEFFLLCTDDRKSETWGHGAVNPWH